MTISPTYLYKVYNPSGTYLGLLQNVSSDFNYNQNIATAFVQSTIIVEQSADTSNLPLDYIYDETGNIITDENSDNLKEDRAQDVVGSSNSNALIANNNLIRVYEFTDSNVNGKLVFDGYISKWKTKFGIDDNIEITALSQGTDMNNIVLATGDSASISQATDNSTTLALNPGNGKGSLDYQTVVQSFVPASAISIGGASVELTTPESGTLSISVRQMTGTTPNPSTEPSLASGTLAVPTLSTKTVKKVTFAIPTTLGAGSTYYIMIGWSPDSGSTNAASLYLSSLNPYASGSVWTIGTTGTYLLVSGTYSTYDAYFIIWAHGTSTNSAYTNQDVTTILTDVMSNYSSGGGRIIIPPASGATTAMLSEYSDATLPTGYWGNAFAQKFTPSAPISLTNLNLYLGISSTSPVNVTVQVVRGDPSLDTDQVISGGFTYTFGGTNTVIGTSNTQSVSNTSPQAVNFTFPSTISLSSGVSYYLLLTFNQAEINDLVIRAASAAETPADAQVGRLYFNNFTFNNVGGAPALNASYPYMYFSLNPGTAGGYALTGKLATYTFKLQTILQAVQTLMGFAPSTWYWYVDPATGILQFAQASATADFKLIRGRHIEELAIEATKENIKNVVYFSGGDDGTATNTNILVKRTGTQGTNRIGLALLSDNRVNSTSGSVTSAQALADAYIADNASEQYQTTVTINNSSMDTSTIKLGQMVGFAGFGNFVETLLLQVVGINRQPDQVILQLGTLPNRPTQAITDLNNRLSYLETVNTTTTPS